jgi:hypothetical protein
MLFTNDCFISNTVQSRVAFQEYILFLLSHNILMGFFSSAATQSVATYLAHLIRVLEVPCFLFSVSHVR